MSSTKVRSTDAHKANVEVCARLGNAFDPSTNVSSPSLKYRTTDDSITVLKSTDGDQPEETFYFDKTFGPDVSNTVIFDSIGRPLAEHVMRGTTVCLMTVGPSWAGKSETMIGHHDMPGLILLMIEHLVKQLGDRLDRRFCNVVQTISVYEQYGERFRDLVQTEAAEAPLAKSLTMSQGQLASARRTKSAVDLVGAAEAEFIDVRMRTTTHGTQVEGLRKYIADNGDVLETRRWLSETLDRRTGAGRGRAASALGSKVHLFVDYSLRIVDKMNSIAKSSTLRFVEMCGSEKINRVRPAGSLSTVYRSLHALRTVVDTIVDAGDAARKKVTPPYRDSHFTVLLTDALGGSCRTTIIAQMPSVYVEREEALFALSLAQKMKLIVCNVASHEEVVDCAVGELQKELTLLREMAQPGTDETREAELQVMNQELQSIELQMLSATANHSELVRQRSEIVRRLETQDQTLGEIKRVLDVKHATLRESQTLEKELTTVVEKQLNASKQVASEVALQEKRNAQLVVHRQRQASIVRRHEVMVTKMESAKQVAEKSRRNELAALFRTATSLTRQKNDVKFFRNENDRMLKKECQLFTRLRDVQQAISTAATAVSEEELKCDLLQEELDEVIEQWETANDIRSKAVSEHRDYQKYYDEMKQKFDSEIAVADEAFTAHRDARHEIAFSLGIRVVEANSELDDLKRELQSVIVELSQVEESIVANTIELEDGLRQIAQVPAMEAELRRLRDAHRVATNALCACVLDNDDIDAEINVHYNVSMPQADTALAEATQTVTRAQNSLSGLHESNEMLQDYIRRKVFSQEAAASPSRGPTKSHTPRWSGQR